MRENTRDVEVVVLKVEPGMEINVTTNPFFSVAA